VVHLELQELAVMTELQVQVVLQGLAEQTELQVQVVLQGLAVMTEHLAHRVLQGLAEQVGHPLQTSAPTPPYPFVYGLFAQTGNSATVSGTTSESTLIDGGVGTLSVPASGFSVGDSFRVDMAGVFDVGNNQTIRIRVKTGSVILADSGAQAITNITDDVWGLSINFTIRQVGVAGVASIVSLGAFHYSKTSNGAVEGFSFNTVNNTTFDTTVNNTLDITVEWGSTSVGNSIYSDIFVLNKIY